jgi:AcrR family transcriptional regulator
MADIKHFDPDNVLDSVVELIWRQGVASTGMQDIVTATGLNRSSLYSTFGGKQDLYLAALRCYVEQRSQPAFDRLAADDRGLPAVAAFFSGLIDARCTGAYARWGCMVSNAHAGAENDDPKIREVLDIHHDRLRAALCGALRHAEDRGQLRSGSNLPAAADQLALLAYGVNLRSRAGADPANLHATVTAALDALSAGESS